MSSKKGETKRNRPQKHQNKWSFKNNLHDTSDMTKKLNAMSICEVCEVRKRKKNMFSMKLIEFRQISEMQECY